MRSEDFVFFVAICALALFLLTRMAIKPDVPPAEVSEAPNARDTVGMSNTADNSLIDSGPRYLMYNTPFMFAAPVAGFVFGRKAAGVY